MLTCVRGLFISFIVVFCSLYVHSHEVNTVYAELTHKAVSEESKPVVLDVYYDVSLSLPEWQGDEIPAPTREWLLFQTEETYQRIQVGAVRYIQESLNLKQVMLKKAGSGVGADVGVELDYKIEFPDFVNSPPDFPKQRDGYAYTIVRVVWECMDWKPTEPIEPIELTVAPKAEVDNEGLQLTWNHPNQDLVLRIDIDVNKELIYEQFAYQQFYSWLPVAAKMAETAEIHEVTKNLSAKTNQTWGGWFGLVSWFKLGFSHIIPQGWDHLLFIAGLFFLARSKRELFTQSLLFTLAHSVVLILMAMGVVFRTPIWIEVAIALSIIYIGVEARLVQSIKLKRLAYWRPLVIVFFGLVHGLAFAEILQGYFSQTSQVWLALLGFNVGIEGAQILIVAMLGLISLCWRYTSWKARVPTYACYAIAIMGIVWLIERIV